jgi:hypothetical protein
MKWVLSAVAIAVFAPIISFAQGVRMSADFLPLAVGNRWVYTVNTEDGKKLGEIDVAVQDYKIISGRSFYALRGFPFATTSEPNKDLQLRYDRQERQFLQVYKDQETPLFLADNATTDVVQADAAGVPQKFALRSDTMTLTFQRGVGIIEGRLQTPNGVRILKIASAHVGEGVGGVGQASPATITAANLPPPPPKLPAAGQPIRPAVVESVTQVTASNPLVQLEAAAAPDGHKLTLTVTNTSDKLLPFRFNSGQTYDFIITNTATGQEVWRWSRRMAFTQVIRSDSLRAKANWKFDVVWNHSDNDSNPAPPGQYAVVGIVASQPAVQSQPVMINLQ